MIIAERYRGRIHATSATIEPAALGHRATAPAHAWGWPSALPPAPRRRLRTALSNHRLEVGASLLLLAIAASAFLAKTHLELHQKSDQVAVETAVTLLATLAAVLFFGRFRRHLRLRDLLLAGALAIVAGSNLSAGVLLANDVEFGGHSAAWLLVGGRLLGWLLIAAAAAAGNRVVKRPGPVALHTLVRHAGWMAALAALIVLLGTHAASHEASRHGPLGNYAAMLSVQIVLALLTGACAVAFWREAKREADPTARLLGLTCAFGAAAALAYCAAPTFYASRIDVGDVLRLGSLVTLLVCVCVEWSLDERQAPAHALARERRRMAADVHDLIMQDLSFALANARSLAEDPGQEPAASTVVMAGERALAGARDVVSGLTEQHSMPIADALETSVRAAARYTPMTLDASGLPASVQPDKQTRDALLHIAREAVTNAVKHARAQSIEVAFSHAGEWRLMVRDDGHGFEANRVEDGFGLASMHRHAHALGGVLMLSSAPGGGTIVEVVLP